MAACCGNVSCDCQGSPTDTLAFRFNLDPANGGYLPAQVDSVYVRRVPLDAAQQLKTDSVLLVRPVATVRQPILLSNTQPLPANGTRKLNQYRYVFRLASRVRLPARPPRQYAISNVQLAGDFQGDGCCTCYRNTKKALTLDGKVYDQTIAGQDTVVLSR
ncbi:hypothetical protein SAMN02745146_0042 [Hymenobacter daecheongensis DSM 21074]|uniref:Uncharacterized protein n=2 Tax=Hymenobacter daecheongensis TaxID=496053 RepID=A0A1M6LSY9_9BACT|nr:hypothetical protein SAMN02745146_0042 [Hymenobacter daecheongensis DSM 21074]